MFGIAFLSQTAADLTIGMASFITQSNQVKSIMEIYIAIIGHNSTDMYISTKGKEHAAL